MYMYLYIMGETSEFEGVQPITEKTNWFGVI